MIGCAIEYIPYPKKWPSKAELRQSLTYDFTALTAWWQNSANAD